MTKWQHIKNGPTETLVWSNWLTHSAAFFILWVSPFNLINSFNFNPVTHRQEWRPINYKSSTSPAATVSALTSTHLNPATLKSSSPPPSPTTKSSYSSKATCWIYSSSSKIKYPTEAQLTSATVARGQGRYQVEENATSWTHPKWLRVNCFEDDSGQLGQICWSLWQQIEENERWLLNFTGVWSRQLT